MEFNFDQKINRINTSSDKWDNMKSLFGVSPEDGLPMWVADTDFSPPHQVLDALAKIHEHGILGYSNSDLPLREATAGWMKRRHNWDVNPDHITSTHGLVNAVGLAIQAFTKPGEGVLVFTPVYHAFARVIDASERRLVECPLANNNSRYEMDFEAYEALMTGTEKMLILCSPHNPGGRVWNKAELAELVEFAQKHDLIILSDDVHQDLTFGANYIPLQNAVPESKERLLVLVAASKTFNLAGNYTGGIIIPDDNLRKIYRKTSKALGISVNSFGRILNTVAYNEGDAWVDAQCAYLNENRIIFDNTISEIPGVQSMKLESTYLAWVDFSDLGMPQDEIKSRLAKGAKIAASNGPDFGLGGENFMRFNFGTQRANLIEAMDRLKHAFSDLQ